MKILVTGENGQLGFELKKISLKNNYDWLFTNRKSFDISDLNNINFFLNKHSPDLIINCAAYTSVESAEVNLKSVNITNHKSIELISKWCDDNNCKLIHISTDYVYDGNSILPYRETDKTNPVNSYGKSKLLGDIACQKNNPSCIILRTSWLYSSYGNNFLTMMIRAMQNNYKIEVVDDQFGSPTYAGDLAQTILKIIKYKKWHPGIYNFTNKGKVSWFDFANEIKSICGFDIIIKSVSSKEYNCKANRPKFSILDNSKIINTYKIKPINYLISLKKCIKSLTNE